MLSDLVEERVLGQERRGREGAERHRRDGQRDVPEIVHRLADKESWAQLSDVRPRSGKILPERAAGEEHDQQDREQEARIEYPTITTAEVHTSKDVPSRTAFLIPSGIEIA